MAPLLYKIDASPPASAVRMLAEIIGLELETRDVDFFSFENKSAEFFKINPMGTVPALIDGDFIVSESHAIMPYLLSKYASKEQQEELYPSDLRTRALINQYLFFDTGVLFIRLKTIILGVVFGGADGPTQKELEAIDDAFKTLESYLGDKEYLIGDRLTIADLSLGVSSIGMRAVHTLDAEKFPRVAKWLARLEEKPYFRIQLGAVEIVKTFVKK